MGHHLVQLLDSELAIRHGHFDLLLADQVGGAEQLDLHRAPDHDLIFSGPALLVKLFECLEKLFSGLQLVSPAFHGSAFQFNARLPFGLGL